jgi:hypothetical protein
VSDDEPEGADRPDPSDRPELPLAAPPPGVSARTQVVTVLGAVLVMRVKSVP